MSAVRMVAYGVLENVNSYPRHAEGGEDPLAEKRKERDRIRRMVRDEIREFDLLILPAVVQKFGGPFRARPDMFILYGPATKSDVKGGLVARGAIAQGSFRECCIKAVEFIEPFNQVLSPPTSSEG